MKNVKICTVMHILSYVKAWTRFSTSIRRRIQELCCPTHAPKCHTSTRIIFTRQNFSRLITPSSEKTKKKANKIRKPIIRAARIRPATNTLPNLNNFHSVKTFGWVNFELKFCWTGKPTKITVGINRPFFSHEEVKFKFNNHRRPLQILRSRFREQ